MFLSLPRTEKYLALVWKCQYSSFWINEFTWFDAFFFVAKNLLSLVILAVSVGFLRGYACGCFFHIALLSFRHFGTCRWHMWWYTLILFTFSFQSNSLKACWCCVTNNLTLPPIAATNFPHRLQREHPLYPGRQLPEIQDASLIVCTPRANPHSGCINTPNLVIVCHSRHLTTRNYRDCPTHRWWCLWMENPLVVLQRLPPKL